MNDERKFRIHDRVRIVDKFPDCQLWTPSYYLGEAMLKYAGKESTIAEIRYGEFAVLEDFRYYWHFDLLEHVKECAEDDEDFNEIGSLFE